MTREEILQKAKEEVAKEHGFNSWKDFSMNHAMARHMSLNKIALRCMELVQQETKQKSEIDLMIDSLPQNRPLYKDSGSWQIRSDDMQEVILSQNVAETFAQFIIRYAEWLKVNDPENYRYFEVDFNVHVDRVVQQEGETQSWVSVWDEKPALNKRVLLFMPEREFKGDSTTIIGYYSGDTGAFQWCSRDVGEEEILRPTHWRTLPEFKPENK